MSSTTAHEIVNPDRLVLRAVRFRDERSRTPIPWKGPALELLGARHVARAEKKGTPTFSPVEYEEGAHRGNRGVRHTTALVLDFDGAASRHLTTEQAEFVQRKLGASGWAHLACTTFSHLTNGADDHCFRVLVAVSRPILPDGYEPVWRAHGSVRWTVAPWPWIAPSPPPASSPATPSSARGRTPRSSRASAAPGS